MQQRSGNCTKIDDKDDEWLFKPMTINCQEYIVSRMSAQQESSSCKS